MLPGAGKFMGREGDIWAKPNRGGNTALTAKLITIRTETTL